MPPAIIPEQAIILHTLEDAGIIKFSQGCGNLTRFSPSFGNFTKFSPGFDFGNSTRFSPGFTSHQTLSGKGTGFQRNVFTLSCDCEKWKKRFVGSPESTKRFGGTKYWWIPGKFSVSNLTVWNPLLTLITPETRVQRFVSLWLWDS